MSIPFRPTDHRRVALHFDVLRYSFGMAKLAIGRMTETLDEIAARHRNDQHSEDDVMSALLDAWSIIDMCHRVRELIDQLPQLPRKEPWAKRFFTQSTKVEELRHHIQHLRRTVNDSAQTVDPVWGSLSWVPRDEPEACYMIFTGNLLEGVSASSISYDTHEARYTARVQLSAGGIVVDLVSVAGAIERLRADLINWVKGKPQTTHAYGRTLVWKWNVLGAPGIKRVVEL